MKENPIDKALQDLQIGASEAMKHLEQAMQEYLTKAVDLEKVSKMMEGMGILNIIGMKAESIPGLGPYRILGLDKSATDDEVKERYGALLHKIHPDVADVKGTEFLTQMVVLAYDIISKERGWS